MTMRHVTLTEWQELALPAAALDEPTARVAHDKHRHRVDVEPPSFRNDQRWILRPRGVVGHFPVTDDLAFVVHPKVPIGNLFRMLERVYDLRPDLPEGRAHYDSMDDFYSRFASLLAHRVLHRNRRGLHREYVGMADESPFVRGQLDVRDRMTRPWSVRPRCGFEEHTADIDDNRILAWTLRTIARSPLCRGEARDTVRRAYRVMAGRARCLPFEADECVDRLYTRLNADYDLLHGLCRFFLSTTVPSLAAGDALGVPFVVEMDQLFERYVASWLGEHLPLRYEARAQERVAVGADKQVTFRVDLVVRDRETGDVLWVLDTKYKSGERVKPSDFHQIVSYAEILGARRAGLIYPQERGASADYPAGDVLVRPLGFALDGDLDEAGCSMLAQLDLAG